MIARLASISTAGFPGLPDLEVGLQPITAVIGPRASGKSRLLTAISWLLSGAPTLMSDPPAPLVTAELTGPAGRRTITRGQAVVPESPIPEVVFLAARDRLPPAPEAASMTGSDATSAEAMVAAIAERRLSGVEGEVLLIEEPELMLTPHQQRHFYGLLRRYAEQNQVVYSTRSPSLLDAVHYHEILRLDLSQDGVAIRRARPELMTDEQRLRLQAEFDRERTEMFFATCVVLVEGQTERLSLPLIFRRLGHDPDALGISIVEVGGKGNLPLIASVLGEMAIPRVVVYDTDGGWAAQRENAALRAAIGGAPAFALQPDFEAVAGIRDRDDKILAAWKRFSKLPPGRIPEVFRQIVETAVSLATGAKAGVGVPGRCRERTAKHSNRRTPRGRS